MKKQVLKIYQAVTKTEPSFIMKKIFFFTRIFSIDKDGPLNIFFQHRKRISVFYVLRCNERWSTFLLLHKMFFTVMTYLSFKMNKEIFSCVYFYFEQQNLFLIATEKKKRRYSLKCVIYKASFVSLYYK